MSLIPKVSKKRRQLALKRNCLMRLADDLGSLDKARAYLDAASTSLYKSKESAWPYLSVDYIPADETLGVKKTILEYQNDRAFSTWFRYNLIDGESLVTWPDTQGFWISKNFHPFKDEEAMNSEHAKILNQFVLDHPNAIVLFAPSSKFLAKYHITGGVNVSNETLIKNMTSRERERNSHADDIAASTGRVIKHKPINSHVSSIACRDQYNMYCAKESIVVYDDFRSLVTNINMNTCSARPGLYISPSGAGKSYFCKVNSIQSRFKLPKKIYLPDDIITYIFSFLLLPLGKVREYEYGSSVPSLKDGCAGVGYVDYRVFQWFPDYEKTVTAPAQRFVFSIESFATAKDLRDYNSLVQDAYRTSKWAANSDLTKDQNDCSIQYNTPLSADTDHYLNWLYMKSTQLLVGLCDNGSFDTHKYRDNELKHYPLEYIGMPKLVLGYNAGLQGTLHYMDVKHFIEDEMSYLMYLNMLYRLVMWEPQLYNNNGYFFNPACNQVQIRRSNGRTVIEILAAKHRGVDNNTKGSELEQYFHDKCYSWEQKRRMIKYGKCPYYAPRTRDQADILGSTYISDHSKSLPVPSVITYIIDCIHSLMVHRSRNVDYLRDDGFKSNTKLPFYQSLACTDQPDAAESLGKIAEPTEIGSWMNRKTAKRLNEAGTWVWDSAQHVQKYVPGSAESTKGKLS